VCGGAGGRNYVVTESRELSGNREEHKALKIHTEKSLLLLQSPSQIQPCLSTNVGLETLKLSGPDGKPTRSNTPTDERRVRCFWTLLTV
jgi:hypothetical protein